MKQIRLFGDLVKFKSEWLLDVLTVAEAVRAIEANRPGFVAAASAGDYLSFPRSAWECRVGRSGVCQLDR